MNWVDAWNMDSRHLKLLTSFKYYVRCEEEEVEDGTVRISLLRKVREKKCQERDKGMVKELT